MPRWLIGLLVYIAWLGFGWSLKKILFAWLRVATAKTETKLDDAVIAAANFPMAIMIAVWGAAAVIHYVVPDLPALWSHRITMASKIATLGAAVLFIDFLISKFIELYSSEHPALRGAQAFATTVGHVVILSIGFLIVLESLGISITPIIASLGIGSLAVALALQPTFENIFSGLQILMDQPVLPGHYIKLESGEEGFVEKIGWRTSWIRQMPNNTVIIPNKQLVNARITNFNYPSKDLAIPVEVGVHYNSDLEKVERVCIEVAQNIQRTVNGGVPDFQPLVRYSSFGASSINFAVILRAKEFSDGGLLKHELIKALSKRFAKEGIVMPYPIVALNTSQEKVPVPQVN